MTDPVDDLRASIARRDAVVVAGAGIAVAATESASVASWRGLLESGITCCETIASPPDGWGEILRRQLDLGDVESWLAVAEQVTQRFPGASGGGEFRRWLRETIGALTVRSPGEIKALIRLGVPIATTNYDNLIEDVSGARAVTWRDGARTQRVLRGDDSGVAHLHGHWQDPTSVILGIRSYEHVLSDPSAQSMLRGLASMRSLVLVGFGAGLEDPNFAALRGWMRDGFSDSEYRHFRLVRDQERDAVAAQHGDGERIIPIVYGEEHTDLEPFLATLGETRVDARPLGAPKDPRGSYPGSNLPPPPLCFGRDGVIEGIVSAITDVEPVPIPVLGAPGIGKSAVSLASAHDPRVAARFRARRHWVRCDGSLSRGGLVADIAEALDLAPGTSQEPSVLGALAAEPTLLILDNAEVPWIEDMTGTEELLARLAEVPGLALVCSFRGAERPLGPRWQSSIVIPPLDVEAARQVFLAIAGDRFASDPDLDEMIIDLDGMPIAIELLAQLAQAEPDLGGLRRRWSGKRTDLLSRGPSPDRHLSVAVSFELSINGPQTTPDGRLLLSILALLPDGVAVEDLDRLLPGEGDEAAATLRRAGLAFDEEGRLRVLKPIRDHVAQHYEPPPDVKQKAFLHYLLMAQSQGPNLGGTDGAAAARTLTSETGNINAAVRAGLEGQSPDSAMDATFALTDFARFTGVSIESLFELAREAAQRIGDKPREVEALRSAALIHLDRTQYEDASEKFNLARQLFEEIGDQLGQANCIRNLGQIAFERSDHETAQRHCDEALPIFREAGSQGGEANCMAMLAEVARVRSDTARARDLFEKALAVFRTIGDTLGEANCIGSLGQIEYERYDFAAARERFQEARPLYRQAASTLGEANCIFQLGQIAAASDDYEEARRCHLEAQPLFQRVGALIGEANCICGLGVMSLNLGDHDDARKRLDRALDLYKEIDAVLGQANCLKNLGKVALAQSEPDRAESYFEGAIPLYDEVGDLLGKANSLTGLAQVAASRSDDESMRTHFEGALALYRQIDNPVLVGQTHARLAYVATDGKRREDHLAAARDTWRKAGREDLIAQLDGR